MWKDSCLVNTRCAVCRPSARTDLRRQVGTLRFDLTALAETKPKEEKKKAFAAKKEFFVKVNYPCWIWTNAYGAYPSWVQMQSSPAVT